jgi:hypothetical protein
MHAKNLNNLKMDPNLIFMLSKGLFASVGFNPAEKINV